MRVKHLDSLGAGDPHHPERDIDSFLSARFHELHAVAAITIGDPETALHVTAAALAERWDDLFDDGAPNATARAAVLSAALSAAAGGEGTGTVALERSLRPSVRDDSPLWCTVSDILAAATPTARAALAVQHFWNEPVVAVGGWAGTDPAQVRAELGDLRQRLVRAIERTSAGPEGQRLIGAEPDGLSAVLERLAASSASVDARTAVDQARADSRRRRIRVNALMAVAVLVGAVIGALAWPTSAPVPAQPALPPHAPEWDLLTTWSPRGPLVGDPHVSALVEDRRAVEPGTRLLWAGPVGETTAVVMTSREASETGAEHVGRAGEASGSGRVSLRLWTTSRDRATDTLSPAHIEGSRTPAAPDVVAISIQQPDPAADPVVLVMTRPTVTEGSARTGARPDPSGGARAIVRTLTAMGGVATFEENAAYPSRVTINNTTSSPAGSKPFTDRLPGGGSAEELAGAQISLLSSVTGYPVLALDTVSQVDADVPMSPFGCPTAVTDGGSAHVTVVTAATRDGSFVRTTRMSSRVQGEGTSFLERLTAVPASDRARALLPVPGCSRPTFVALAPDAATAELVAPDGRVLDESALTGGLGVLTTDAKEKGRESFRLRLATSTGRVIYDRVPPTGVELLEQ